MTTPIQQAGVADPLPWKAKLIPRECKCRLCERGREFDKMVKPLGAKRKAFFNELYDALNHAEFDLDWLKLQMELEAESRLTQSKED